MSEKRNPYVEANTLGLASNDDQHKVADITQGGILGHRGFHAGLLDIATPITFAPTTIVVLQTPTMYNAKIGRLIKQLIESYAKSVSGIDFAYTVESEGAPAGHDGQEFNVPTRLTRDQPEPAFTFNELTGNIIHDLFNGWGKDTSDPETGAVGMHLASNPNAGSEAFRNGSLPIIMSTYTMTMMAIQYDRTFRPENVLAAALYTNMYPSSLGEMGFERPEGGAARAIEREISFNSIVHESAAVKQYAKDLARELSLAGTKYELSGSDLVPKSTEVPSSNGLRDDINDIGLMAEAGGSNTGDVA